MVEELLRWGWALAIATNLLLVWIGWSLRQQFVPRREFDNALKDLQGQLSGALAVAAEERQKASARLTRIEERQAAAPSHQDLTRIHERLDRIADVTGRLEGALKPLDRLTILLTQAQLDKERA
ncbi:hypothetical protein [Telmatospirillum sp. J64-1]|uniref:hypothetical protein n=1 Tax=Telmatospirillum sp. J64-1 TaxID=2502183 RepID=UPI00115E7FA7|nr:hypothetical protein [Telmatospirillum sp. J64-1]